MNIRYHLLILFLFIATNLSAQIRVNEIMASNSSTISDEQGDFDDWIEIINLGEVSVNFGGMYVSDDPENLIKWQIPTDQSASTTIAPGQYLLIWFDDDTDDGALHVEPKLSASGEFVILTESDGVTIIQSVEFGEQETDVSWATTEEGGDVFAFQTPSPGEENGGGVVKIPAEAPTFTLETGFYSGNQLVGIETESDGTEIRYTTDATVPTESSLLYEDPVSIDESTILRAIAVGGDFSSSPVSTNTYLYDESHTIPVVSFVMDPDSLFSEDLGMLAYGDAASEDYPFKGANFWEDWEYPVHLEFMATTGNIEFEISAGASIGGNFSRGFNKKSFIINNNEEYGEQRLEYELFEENDYDEYDGFGLRAGAEERSRLLNELMYAINQKWNHNNDMQAGRPVVIYINGDYWGIYLLQERKNDDFVESRYGYEDIDMIKDYDGLKDGSWDAYYDLVDEIVDLDADSDEFFEFIEANINLDSFTDHWIYQVYSSHGDPNNLRYWKAREVEGAKWNYITHDFDWWRNLGREPEEYTSSFKDFIETGTYDFWILGKMMANPTYQEFYLNRLGDMLNTAFKPENVLALIDSIDTFIDPEMARDIARWDDGWFDIGGPTNYDMEYIRDVMEDYTIDYPQYIYKEVLDTLGVDTVRVHIEQLTGGEIQLNSISPRVDSESWSGIYFQGNTISLYAESNPGSTFSEWLVNGESAGNSMELMIELTDEPVSISATFVELSEVVVINEINYNSLDENDAGDWIELYNPSGSSIDLTGWTYFDEKDTLGFTIPNGTVIDGNGFLVISNDLTKFTEQLPWAVMDAMVIGSAEFGLSGNNDQVRIYNAQDILVDAVSYDDESPWPIDADGTGYTIELDTPELDNSLAESWAVSNNFGGTPGYPNKMIIDAIDDLESVPSEFNLSQNYPNPFNPSTNINFNIANSARVELSIFNVLGQKVHTLIDGSLNAGQHSVTFDATGLTSGVYFYRLTAGANTATQKMLLMK